jgi:hypothetical protein
MDGSTGHIIICDNGNHRVQICTRDGEFVRCIGGGAPMQFNSPWGAAVDGEAAQIIVADYNNKRIQIITG